LEGDDVCKVVEADGQGDDFLGQACQLALHKLRLTHTRTAHKHDGLAQVYHHIQEETQ
jgi:hypothetical protein